jgi:hypothetical protein
VQDDTQLSELRIQVAELEARLRQLTLAVMFRPSERWAEALLTLGVDEAARSELNLILHYALLRATGEYEEIQPPRMSSELVAQAATAKAITREEVVRLVCRAVGANAPIVGERLLVAHRDSGYGPEGHAALGT